MTLDTEQVEEDAEMKSLPLFAPLKAEEMLSNNANQYRRILISVFSFQDILTLHLSSYLAKNMYH